MNKLITTLHKNKKNILGLNSIDTNFLFISK